MGIAYREVAMGHRKARIVLYREEELRQGLV
jgi:hypothetical protein